MYILFNICNYKTISNICQQFFLNIGQFRTIGSPLVSGTKRCKFESCYSDFRQSLWLSLTEKYKKTRNMYDFTF